MKDDMRIGFVGGGKMAEAMMRGFSEKTGNRNILVYDPSRKRLDHLKKTYRVKASRSNLDLVRNADIIILAVKPFDVGKVCQEVRDLAKGKLFISIAAGVTLSYLSDCLGNARIVRTMPNTPALVGQGMTVIASSPETLKKDVVTASRIFSHIGEVLVMDEKLIDAVTAVSGSGPAFVSLFVEALVDGAVRMGIPREPALQLVLQTVQGSVSMIKSGIHPAELREMVTSPGGTTAEGLSVMEHRGFKGIIGDAVKKACERAANLAQ